MATSPFLRVLSLLLLLLPASLQAYLPAASNRRPASNHHGVDDELHPIVLVPGGSCSDLEARLTEAYRPSIPRCGAMKGKGWFGLWHNASDLAARDYVPCFMEQMSLVYDPDANEYRNFPGVETRVLNFGSSTGFHSNPLHPEWCFGQLRPELERLGYVDGETLFGAPYDLRRVPPIPGQPSRVYSRYFRQLTSLIEHASSITKKKKVILFGHSQGGMVALEFLRAAAPQAWQRKYIKHLVLVSPLPASAGFVLPVMGFVSGSGLLDVPTATPLSLRPMWRTFESALFGFPSPAVFTTKPVVITRRRNYTASARDMEDLLADVGAGDAVEPFRRRRRRLPPRSAAVVPVTCVNGVGTDTPEQMAYWEGDFDAAPEVVYGDGDGTINLASMLAFDEEMTRRPGQYKTIKLRGASHGSLLAAEWSLKRVIQEVLIEATNRV
ncbi:hypothetical protein PR202_ga23500 [Eleusine coracana subsp. coracana]|uniref:Uncharacterized protein n=1 Tax=Eleusine coracana subsp. coracana TaxID=191504 RepID=A0AAV5D6T3_ELECO|nr:hypothetical protein QOZ80_1AG0009390 [Eleusine coracana subsp. coracana]GJN05832.1 hypothetical protein PR202_ga23500 [Eleusine coracana subsp. coracana]